MTRKRKGRVKRGESNLASDQIHKCLSQPEHQRDSLSSREKREEVDRGDLDEKREGQKGREQSSQ